MLGRRFCPRIRGLKKQRLYRLDAKRDYGPLANLVGRADRMIDPQVITRMGLAAGVLMPLLLVIPLMLGWQYRITRAKHMITRQELDRRRAAATGPRSPEDDLPSPPTGVLIAPIVPGEV